MISQLGNAMKLFGGNTRILTMLLDNSVLIVVGQLNNIRYVQASSDYLHNAAGQTKFYQLQNYFSRSSI
jgi:hypothetical protein